jgi:hypothetical protein
VQQTTIKAYPNPFSHETHVTFTVERDGYAWLELYDMSGRKIGLLFDGEIDAGHTYTTTLHGDQLTSGLYFCRLIYSDGTSKVKKIVFAPGSP